MKFSMKYTNQLLGIPHDYGNPHMSHFAIFAGHVPLFAETLPILLTIEIFLPILKPTRITLLVTNPMVSLLGGSPHLVSGL